MSVTTPVFSAIVVMKSLQRLREKSLLILTFCAYQDEDTRRATQKPTPDMDCNWPSASNRVRQQSDGSPSTAVARDSGARRHLTYTEGVEAGPQPVDHQVNFGGGDVQRWHEAKDRRSRRIEQQAGIACGTPQHQLLAGMGHHGRCQRLAEVQGTQQSDSACRTQAVLRGQRLQSLAQMVAGGAHLIQETVSQYRIHHRQTDCTHQGIAIERATLVAMGKYAGRLPGQQRTDRHTTAQPLGQRHDVGCDAKVLVAEQAAQATDAGPNLVADT